METISFTIPFGDTSDPEKVAAEIARDLQFCNWMVSKSDDGVEDEGIAATKFTLMGWTTEW